MPAGVGAYLRALRERQGVSIDEIARSTRVLHHYLEALESDDLASLPAPVFAKGFIRAYCQALGVPPDEAITLYEKRAGHIRERVTIAPAPAPPPPPPPLLPPPTPAQQAQVAAVERRDSRSRGAVLISFVLLVVMGAALYAVTMALQSGRDEVGGATATQVASTPAPEPVPAPTPEPATPEPLLRAGRGRRSARRRQHSPLPARAPGADRTDTIPGDHAQPKDYGSC